MEKDGLLTASPIPDADVGLLNDAAAANDDDALLASLQSRFSVVDYCVFALLLGVSGAIGLWFGFKKKQKTTTDFLMAGRSMGTFPMAMSLIARRVYSTDLDSILVIRTSTTICAWWEESNTGSLWRFLIITKKTTFFIYRHKVQNLEKMWNKNRVIQRYVSAKRPIKRILHIILLHNMRLYSHTAAS